MIRLSVYYPTTEGATFDHDYYREKHVPLAVKTWGLVRPADTLVDLGAVDVEDLVETTEGDPGADAQAELDELVVGEGGVQTRPEVVVDRTVIERETLGEFDAEPLPLRVAGPRPVLDVGVEVLGGRIGIVGPTRHVAC